jgi:hypothetical protein
MTKWYVPDLTWVSAPPFESDASYLAAVAWAREFSPEAGKDSYSAALQHANQKYSTSLGHFDALDKKADDLMRTAVTVAALLVAAVKAFDVEMSGWMVAAFLCFLAAVVVSAIARRPGLQATPGEIREVLGFAEDFRISDRFQVEALVAASLHCAVVGMEPAIRWKSDQLRRATVLFVVGVLLLLSIAF